MTNSEKKQFEWAVHSIVDDNIFYDKNGDIIKCLYKVKWIDERTGLEQMSQAQLDAYSDRYITKMTIIFNYSKHLYKFKLGRFKRFELLSPNY